MKIKVKVWYHIHNGGTQPSKSFELSDEDIQQFAFQKFLETRSFPEEHWLDSVDIESITL